MVENEQDKGRQQATVNILQQNFIWKSTKEDGLLPVTNFAAAGDQKSGKITKNKSVAINSSNMGKITQFEAPKDI